MAQWGRQEQQDTKNRLFIGGVSRSSTEDALKAYFDPFGATTNVKIVKNPETQESKGFAFISFEDASVIDEIQAKRPHNIDGREVSTKRVLPKDENGQTDNSQVKKLFVGGIKNDITEDELRDIFAAYGNIVKISIPTDRETQRQKGFVFIEYDDVDAVDKAVVYKDEISIGGKSVGVKKAIEKDQNSPFGRGGGTPRGGRGGYGGSPYGGGRGSPYGGGRGGYESYDQGYSPQGYGGGYGGRGGYGGGRGGRGGRGGGRGAPRGGSNGYQDGYGY